MRTLFLTWQDPKSRRWFPIGRLSVERASYRFVYTRGAQDAHKTCGFQPLEAFPSFERSYESAQLFSLFANRLPPVSRRDYSDFVEYLNLPPSERDPIVLLGRSSGERMTDTMQVFPSPEPSVDGRYEVQFFANGINHMPEISHERIKQLQVGERLLLLKDFQNEYDNAALLLRTLGREEKDLFLVGYVPRYLLEDAIQIVDWCPDASTQIFVRVERINLPPAPKNFRLLCRMSAPWPQGFEPFQAEKYRPIC